jgi:superfamily II DNA or RNA helicase
MSINIKLSELSDENREKINSELQIKLENNKFNKFAPPKYIYPYEIDSNDNVIVPFSYGCRKLKIKRPNRNKFSEINVTSAFKPREEQNELIKESLNTINKKGSVIISAYTGFGKCLGFDTDILMYNGTIKKVQEIKVGDKIMGDDSTERNILSICRGTEQMYKISYNENEYFKANESHILSLYLTIPYEIIKFKNIFKVKFYKDFSYKLTYFKSLEEAKCFCLTLKIPEIIDISIKNYLNLENDLKNNLKSFKNKIEFTYKYIKHDPYSFSLWFFGNELFSNKTIKERVNNKFKNFDKNSIPYNYKCNNKKNRLELLAGILDIIGIVCENKYYKLEIKSLVICKDIVFVSQSLGLSTNYIKIKDNYIIYIKGDNLDKIPVRLLRKKIISNKKIKENFITYDFKIEKIKETKYYGFTIDGNNRFVLGDFTITHNTFCSIYLSRIIGFKTLIIVNKIVLMKQWEESIMKFCNGAIVQRLTTKSKYNQNADYYIMNAINVSKKDKNFFSDIGLVIVDEAHLIMAETLSKSLGFVYPRYLIALTATPYRPDGLDILLTLYFGEKKIIRKLHRAHIVYKIETGFKPLVKLANNGRVNWGALLDSQANDEDRNNFIVKLVKKYKDRTFLILTKRISQGNFLLERFIEENESVTSLLGSQQDFDNEARILIGTCQKCGVGFDHPKLDTLLLACDLEEYFIQYLGRVFRRKDVKPIIFDLVDNNGILKKHFTSRRIVYREHGGIIKNLDKNNIN